MLIIQTFNRTTVCFLHSGLSDSDCCKVNVISVLSCVKHHYIYLAVLSSDDVNFVTKTLCS